MTQSNALTVATASSTRSASLTRSSPFNMRPFDSNHHFAYFTFIRASKNKGEAIFIVIELTTLTIRWGGQQALYSCYDSKVEFHTQKATEQHPVARKRSSKRQLYEK